MVESGRIRKLRRPGDDAVDVAIELSRKGARINTRADVIFDCTGPAPNLAGVTSGVIRSLLESGLATADPSGLGLHAEPTGEIVTSHGRCSGIFAVGPLVRGLTYEATAVPELRVQAERTAAVISGRLAASSPQPLPRLSSRSFADVIDDPRQ